MHRLRELFEISGMNVVTVVATSEVVLRQTRAVLNSRSATIAEMGIFECSTSERRLPTELPHEVDLLLAEVLTPRCRNEYYINGSFSKKSKTIIVLNLVSTFP